MRWKGFKDVQATIEIDLKNKKEEDLWNSLDKDARWGVNKAEKSGLKIELTENENTWKEFYKIYKKTCQYGNIIPFEFKDIKKSKLFACFLKNKLIAGAVVRIKDKKIILFLNASSHEFLKYQPNNLLYWSIIKWGKQEKFEIFDLGGYQLNAKKSNKLYHINRFKSRWGGEIKKYHIYSKNPFYILGRKIIRNFYFIKKIRDDLKVWRSKKRL